MDMYPRRSEPLELLAKANLFWRIAQTKLRGTKAVAGQWLRPKPEALVRG
jgi:hypothetical protein